MTTPHIMLDIETLGTTPGCVIASIGACTFAPESGEVARQTFYDLIDIGDAVGAGLTIEYGTVLWWLRQSDEARAEITRQDARSPLKEALDNLSAWYLEIGADETARRSDGGETVEGRLIDGLARQVDGGDVGHALSPATVRIISTAPLDQPAPGRALPLPSERSKPDGGGITRLRRRSACGRRHRAPGACRRRRAPAGRR